MERSSAWTAPACQAGGGCPRVPCFRIQVPAGRVSGRQALACGAHLGEVARDLAAWAHGRGLTAGQLTVLAIDPRRPVPSNSPDRGRPGVVVGSFPLVGPAELSPAEFSPVGRPPRTAWSP
jgi:hypothetical protein